MPAAWKAPPLSVIVPNCTVAVVVATVNVPPDATVRFVPAASPPVLPSDSVPAVTVRPPVDALFGLGMISVPAPSLTRPPGPVMALEIVLLTPEALKMRLVALSTIGWAMVDGCSQIQSAVGRVADRQEQGVGGAAQLAVGADPEHPVDQGDRATNEIARGAQIESAGIR